MTGTRIAYTYCLAKAELRSNLESYFYFKGAI